MAIEARGEIFPGLYALGRPEVPIFLLRCGEQWAVVEGGVSALSGLVVRQLTDLVGDLGRITFWFITHSHYDHCGLLPYIVPLLPNVRIYACAATAAAFKKSAALRVIRTLNEGVDRLWWEEFGPPLGSGGACVSLDEIEVNVVANGEDLLLPGGNVLHMMETPGHSACQSAFIDPRRGWCFVSDALGEFLAYDMWCPLVFHDAAKYIASVHSLMEFAPKVLLPAHHAVFTGKEARRAMRDAERCFFTMREKALAVCSSPDAFEMLAVRLTQELGSRSRDFVSGELHTASMRKMLALLARADGGQYAASI